MTDLDRLISIDAETNGLAGRAFAVAATLTDPIACALCGIPRREHAQHYFAGHTGDNPRGYVAPDSQTRLARMRARRAARSTA